MKENDSTFCFNAHRCLYAHCMYISGTVNAQLAVSCFYSIQNRETFSDGVTTSHVCYYVMVITCIHWSSRVGICQVTRVSAGIYSYNTGAVSCLVCKRGCGRVFSFSLRVCHVPRLSLCLNAFYVSASLFLSVCLLVCVCVYWRQECTQCKAEEQVVFLLLLPLLVWFLQKQGTPSDRQKQREEVIYKHTLFTIKMLSVSHFCVCVLLTLCEKVDLY